MRISGTEPRQWSLAKQFESSFKKLESVVQKVPKQVEARREGVINSQNYNFNQYLNTEYFEVPLSRMFNGILDDEYTVTTSIDKTLHQFLTVTDPDLITEFGFLPNCARFP